MANKVSHDFFVAMSLCHFSRGEFCVIISYMVMVFIFLFGLAIGSFLNALIWRLHTGESILRGRSCCPKCEHVLGFWDLIPILSFFIQKGKCRYCGKHISWQYPAVELATAVLFVAAYLILVSQFLNFSVPTFRRNPEGFFGIPSGLWSGSGPYVGIFQFFSLLRMWFFIAVMVVIFVYDLKYSLILNKVIYPAAGVALLTSPLIGDGTMWWRDVLEVAVAAAIGGGFFLLQYALSKGKWIGGGDVKFGLLMGLILGIKGLLVALFFSYVFGALVGVGLIVAGKKTMKSQIPFGTFLAVGTIIAMFWGKEILEWYLR